jgi:hypothetical protein
MKKIKINLNNKFLTETEKNMLTFVEKLPKEILKDIVIAKINCYSGRYVYSTSWVVGAYLSNTKKTFKVIYCTKGHRAATRYAVSLLYLQTNWLIINYT